VRDKGLVHATDEVVIMRRFQGVFRTFRCEGLNQV
jgi:hypothetical protein